MEIGWLTNSSPTRLLRRFLHPKPPQSEGVRVRVTQTGPIFRLPNELFLDILSHFPVVDYLDYYLRAQLVPLRRPKLPKVYYWWFTVLVSLTSTCWDMRLKLLPVLWGRIQTYVEVGSLMDYESKMPQLLLLRCAILSKTPSIAVHVKVLSVSLTFHGWYMESSLSSFVGCLYALPNLHTLEIVYCLSGRYPAGVKRAFAAVSLPNILTLTLHSRAGDVIKACPNVKEVTLICGGSNIPDSVVELLADMRHTIRRIAVLHGSPAGVAKLAERFPTLGELSLRQASD
ncbi:hypothetical protein BJ322DRAFT_224398 [Thelephora terrestris]|uniref:Uncharacterized protein n=1 Tax=Thelephora terrestris TaxID=56493 RepID=A0A9P6H9M0_9AGAM|nr:hypothetical protein BJ322DRAFT_224398 [Thelephora terrestris]